MAPRQEIVITGVGVVSPIGIGREAFAAGLAACRSGVRRLPLFDRSDLPLPVGAAVADFDAKRYVRPRKSLKVMSRDIQFAFAAADLGRADAGLVGEAVDPDRLGVVFGADLMPCELSEVETAYRACTVDGHFDFHRWGPAAMAEVFPLWMLKYLPNMPACHIGIAQDARGPNNSVTLDEVSSLSAVAEALRVIERGHADVMIAGGVGARIHPVIIFRGDSLRPTCREQDPARMCRPFDAERRGMVNGEGAAAFILESRRHAEARGARICARILGYASTFEARRNGEPLSGRAIRQAIRGALSDAGLPPAAIGHVNASGMSTVHDDRIEAQAIREVLGDVPVTAAKSYFGSIGAGAGAVEMAVSLIALETGSVPPTLNYEQPDPQCPVNVVRGRPLAVSQRIALLLNHVPLGQAVAMVIAAE